MVHPGTHFGFFTTLNCFVLGISHLPLVLLDLFDRMFQFLRILHYFFILVEEMDSIVVHLHLLLNVLLIVLTIKHLSNLLL